MSISGACAGLRMGGGFAVKVLESVPVLKAMNPRQQVIIAALHPSLPG